MSGVWGVLNALRAFSRYVHTSLTLVPIVIGKMAPKICPVCMHPQSYFELEAKNY